MPKMPATGIKLGSKHPLGALFEQVKANIPNAVSTDYLHISTSVIPN